MKIMGIDLGKARTGVCVSDLSGFLAGRNEYDTLRMARTLLDEFRAGKLGRITLELPPEV